MAVRAGIGSSAVALHFDEAEALIEIAATVLLTNRTQALTPVPASCDESFEQGGGRLAKPVSFAAKNGSLQALAMRYCSLESIPAALGQFAQLRHLDLAGNRLSDLPASLAGLAHLRSLYLDENCLQLTSRTTRAPGGPARIACRQKPISRASVLH